MTDIRVRPTTRADIPAVDQLLAESYPALLKNDYPPSVLVTALPLISRANPSLVTSGSYYVAEVDGTAKAAGGWTKASPVGQGAEARSTGHIRHVVTHPSAVRRGLARAIMARSFEDAKAAGLTALVCLSTRTAVPFYTSVGFHPESEIEIELRPGIRFPAIRMARDL